MRARASLAVPVIAKGTMHSKELPPDSQTHPRCLESLLGLQVSYACLSFADVLNKFLPWLVWLSGLSGGLQTKGPQVQFPVRADAWVMGQVPQLET